MSTKPNTAGATAVAEPAAIQGWHFAGKKLRDGRALPKAGVTLKCERCGRTPSLLVAVQS